MTALNKNDRIKPGLEEAIHPEIGNNSLFATDDHSFSLSAPDPLKSIDHHLMDEETRLKITAQWNAAFKEQGETEFTPPSIPDVNLPEEKTKEISSKPGDTWVPTFTKETELTDENFESYPASESKKERKKKEKAVLKFSKRIKKVAEKVKKEEMATRGEKVSAKRTSDETNLSPFTNWLKGLSGSEYVHPYHDDYAIDHGTGPSGEGISETFADLLASQGYKDQAIAMYTQLIEKFPEKSSFFAAKIEALQ